MRFLSLFAAGMFCLSLGTGHADELSVKKLTDVVVTGSVEQATLPVSSVMTVTLPRLATSRDSADLLSDVPGAAIVRNGPLTGIVQLRGLSGDRVKVVVDGVEPTPACPNHMDPPMHYIAPSAIRSLNVVSGVTPVSLGGDSIGGTVIVDGPAPRYGPEGGEQPVMFGAVGGLYRSVNDGTGVDGAFGLAGAKWSASYAGSHQQAHDYDYPDGTVDDTAYQTTQHGLLLATKTPIGQFSTDLGLTRTRDAGTPALPMDLIEDDGYKAGLRYEGEHGFGVIRGRVYVHTIDHLMDNFSLRPAGMTPMSSPASSDDMGASLQAALPRDRHTYRLGVDAHWNRFEAEQQNELTGLRQDTFHDGKRDRLGGFVEWETAWSKLWTTQLGVRADVVQSEAGEIERFFPPTSADAARFNAGDREASDLSLDATVVTQFRPTEMATLELALARKNRAPSLLERYLWTPLSASAGQADGRTYLGNTELEPETSHQVSVGAVLQGQRWMLKATPFYNRVTDYIQGTPIARKDMAGKAVLQYQNVDRADLYGVDASGRYAFTDWLAVAGTLGYVRGKNEDTDDNLYRIAPLRGSVKLQQNWRKLESEVETVLVARQEDVADYNEEPITPGYAIVNLRVSYRPCQGVTVQAGVENLLNKKYADHLGGINRVTDSDVDVGERLPNPGRSVVVAARYEF
jgi:iron complex outermembrane receptor protein